MRVDAGDAAAPRLTRHAPVACVLECMRVDVGHAVTCLTRHALAWNES